MSDDPVFANPCGDRPAPRFGLLAPAVIRAESAGEIATATALDARGVRGGHIELAVPVPHPWFLRGPEAPLPLLLGWPPTRLLRLLNARGGQWLRRKLQRLDLSQLATALRANPHVRSDRLTLARVSLIGDLLESGQRPEWIVLTALPVIPAPLQSPFEQQSGLLNRCYLRLLRVNRRLRKLLDRGAPEEVIRYHEVRLRRTVGAVFRAIARRWVCDPLGTGTVGTRADDTVGAVLVPDPALSPDRCGLPKALALALYRPLLRRRLRELGIPVRLLRRRGRGVHIRAALEAVMRGRPVLLAAPPAREQEQLRALEPVLVAGRAIRAHPLVCAALGSEGEGRTVVAYLPRARTARAEAVALAAAPVWPGGRGAVTADALLGCAYLTAELGGKDDSGEPGEGMVFVNPDEVLSAHAHGRLGVHARITVRLPLDKKVIREVKNETGNAKVEELSRPRNGLVRTTVGRVIFNDALHPNMAFYDLPLSAKYLSRIVADAAPVLGHGGTVALLDGLAKTGFRHATRSGLTLAACDLRIPENKDHVLKEKDKGVEKARKNFDRGVICETERRNQVIDLWMKARDLITGPMMTDLRDDRRVDQATGKVVPYLNPLYLMVHSGACGGVEYIRKLAGMHGLVSRASGGIVEVPIRSNFREGLGVVEYFLSTWGFRGQRHVSDQRRGAAERFTRRLVAAGRAAVITGRDCGTKESIVASVVYPKAVEDRPLADAVRGRVSRDTIRSPFRNEVLVAENELITDAIARRLEYAGQTKVRVRSPLTCHARTGACALCYGAGPGTESLVPVGSSVGIAAALALGRPAAELIGRTLMWGTGGIDRGRDEGRAVNQQDGTVWYSNFTVVKNEDNKDIALTTPGAKLEIWRYGRTVVESFPVPDGAEVLVAHGDQVSRGTELLRWDPHSTPILARHDGEVRFLDVIENRTLQRTRNENVSAEDWIILPCREALNPRVCVVRADRVLDVQPLVPGTVVLVRSGRRVAPGTTLARVPRAGVWSSSVQVGGRERVEDIFDARRPDPCFPLAEVGGRVRVGDRERSKRTVYIQPLDRDGRSVGTEVEHRVSVVGLHLRVHTGDLVQAGESLARAYYATGRAGPDPNDLIRILGVDDLCQRLTEEVREIYHRHRIEIDDRHAETLLARMIRKRVSDPGDTGTRTGTLLTVPELLAFNQQFTTEHVRIADPGDSALARGQVIRRDEFDTECERRDAARMRRPTGERPKPAVGKWVVLGVTEAAESLVPGTGGLLVPTPRAVVAAALAGTGIPARTRLVGTPRDSE